MAQTVNKLDCLFQGYNTIVSMQTKLDSNSTSTQKFLFCTSASISTSQQLITSQGAFNLTKDTLSNYDSFFNYPHRVDYVDIQISLSFYVTYDLLSVIFNNLLKYREQNITLNFYTLGNNVAIGNNVNGKLQFKNCFWNNLSLDVQSHQFVVCNLSFVSLLSHSELKTKKLETYLSYSSYNSVSQSTIESTIGNIFGMTDDGSYYNQFIPYYATGLSFNGIDGAINTDNRVRSWGLSFNQNIVKKGSVFSSGYSYSSEGAFSSSTVNKVYGHEAPVPQCVLFGVLQGNFNFNLFIANDSSKNDDIKMFDATQDHIYHNGTIMSSDSSIKIHCCDRSGTKQDLCELKYGTLQSKNPNLAQKTSVRTVQYSYLFHKFKLLSTITNNKK